MPASRVGPLGKEGCHGKWGSSRAERFEAQRPHSRNGRDHRPYLRLRPRLYRERPPLPGAGLRAHHFHDLRGDLRRRARAVVRGALCGSHLEYHRPQALPRSRRARLRCVRRIAGAGPQRVVFDRRQVPPWPRHRHLHRRGAGLHSRVRTGPRQGLHDRHLPDSHHLGHRHRLLRRRGPS